MLFRNEMITVSLRRCNTTCFCDKKIQNTRWVGRQDSVGLAPPFFGSGGPQTGVWLTKTTKDGKCLSVIFIFW